MPLQVASQRLTLDNASKDVGDTSRSLLSTLDQSRPLRLKRRIVGPGDLSIYSADAVHIKCEHWTCPGIESSAPEHQACSRRAYWTSVLLSSGGNQIS